MIVYVVLFYYIHKRRMKPLNLAMSTFLRYNPRPFSEPDQISSIYKIPHNIKVLQQQKLPSIYFFFLISVNQTFPFNLCEHKWYKILWQIPIAHKILSMFFFFEKKKDNLRNQKQWNKDTKEWRKINFF